jgi:carboxypeptidase C (cathepsin A)
MKSKNLLPRSLAFATGLLLPVLLLGADTPNEAPKPPASDVKTNAAEAKKEGDKKDSEKKDAGDKGDKKEKESKDDLSITTNTVTINGDTVTYRATAGTILMKDEEDKPQVKFFFVAYTRLDGDTNNATRPITFSFNGGPGSASVWLHLGLLGPRRVQMNDDGSLPPPPFHLVNNDYSLLSDTDLVFIDPVSTGFTRTVPGEDPGKYHGVEQDLSSVGNFIRLYTTRYQRWSSPKFLIGESYGTTRAAGLSGFLESRYGLYLNGIVLVSSVLDFSSISFNTGNDLPYVFFLPSETASAWFHKKLPPDLQADRAKALAESEQFALNEYSHALMQGNALPAADRARVVKELARLTGLSEDYIDRANLRVAVFRFFAELLRKEGLIIGRYDARLTGHDSDGDDETPDYDPSYAATLGPFSATFNDYVRNELKFESDLPYEVLTSRVQPWDFNGARNRYLNVADTLREAMTHNPYLKVYIANGYYDLATPYLATRYTVQHMTLAPELRDHITLGYYDAGHMMYINHPSLIALRKDLGAFIKSALPAH